MEDTSDDPRCGEVPPETDSEEPRQRRRPRHKNRVLHTRISEDLSEEIRRFADDLRVPASNLVRNVLEEVFTVVDAVSDDIGELIEDVVGEAEGARDRIRRRAAERRQRLHRRRRAARERAQPSDADREAELRRDEAREAAANAGPEFPDVVGWQPLVLNRAGSCARCGKALERGVHAFAGLTAAGMSGTTLCRECTRELT